ncbi:MAG TPA: hypothetical protein VK843_04475 [Planctomycetota bacterium]|nr:hypothetical protein [Planctomycetota bacterium]
MNALRQFHLISGSVTLVAFLVSGAYMKFRAHPERLSDGAHMMYLSRHIHILASALVQLALASYATPLAAIAGRRLQWIASSLIAASSLLLIAAFALEPMSGHPRTPASTFGL